MRRRRDAALALALALTGGLSLAAAAPGEPAPCTPGTVTWMPATPPALDLLQGDLLGATTQGDGVVVGVVDSGVDATNAHLASAVVGGADLVEGSGRGDVDVSGHGTVIAGIIAARPVPSSGMVGVAPRASVLSVRVFTADSDEARRAGTGPDAAGLAAGIRRAVDQGARVVNVSQSTTSDDDALRSAVTYAREHGALVVASAGNRGTSQSEADGPRYPAAYPGVLAVAATDLAGRPAPESIHGPHVLVAAPGRDVLSSATGAGDCLFAHDEAQSSFATAYVSGAAALVASAHLAETPAQWAYRLMATAARPVPDARDDELGWGVVQPYDAVALVPGPTVRGPASPFGETAAPPAPSAAQALVLTPAGSPWSSAHTAVAVVGVVGVTGLGVLGPLVVLRRRRREATPQA